ncbi:alpha-amylase family protein [Chryseolinea sp. T2]|uniref:alpha-amylase family protein n=1 Tax=Chryseolinea sp. T2 TaxID=3129255 RepID=UPI0030774659
MRFSFLCIVLIAFASCREQKNNLLRTGPVNWPDSIAWWKANNLRVIQTNLPAYEATLNPDSLVDDLKDYSANVLIINAGGIMAFYPTELEDHYVNPYMQPAMLGDVVRKCHEAGIKVIVRFDFSRAHRSIFEKHPDWFYISPDGERIINDDMYVVSINAPYEQNVMFKIVEEVIDKYPVDGIFINMPGYQVRNPYVGKYHGIDQNVYDRERFQKFSGLKLPVKEDFSDPIFKRYVEFKEFTTEELMHRLHDVVKKKNPQIAICTYSEKYVDIVRHESQTNSLPYWPYNASDNVNNTLTSFPHHIVSNASIQQISFQSRYNAVEPAEVRIRLYENIANGSGLDMSMMGDFRNYEDERNYDVLRQVYAHHMKFEQYYGRYRSTAQVAVVSPGSWPSGESAQEYRGIQLMLKESHIQHDLIEDTQLPILGDALQRYKVLILPDILRLDSAAIATLESLQRKGTHLIATNRTFSDNGDALFRIFGAKAIEVDHDGAGFYVSPERNNAFKRLRGQKLISWKFNLGLYSFPEADTLLPIYTPGRPGPPEIIGGHARTKHHLLGLKKNGSASAVLIPANLGRLYYVLGYQQYKNILLDVIDVLDVSISSSIITNAPSRVEVITQEFTTNIPQHLQWSDSDGVIVHLVNLTGYSNTYFEPLTVEDISFRLRTDFKPSSIRTMTTDRPIEFTWSDGTLQFTVPRLTDYEAVIVMR